MNDFLSLAQKRYAVRSYLPKPVEAEKLERILEAGRVAPTAKNTQPFRFLVVQHPERLPAGDHRLQCRFRSLGASL